ncbi:prolyl-tRNA synthetase associated domain-containing protein [Candidatus Pacearchaeota archaeon]|nr:prolyl-tRNA synthetase associated domain-containing protein [Candidatus Pacearchaeota archaeon]
MQIKTYLEKLRIKFKTFKHPPVYTCEQAEKYNKDIKGIHCKNLFMKNKKSNRFFLVILPADEKLDIKKLEGQLAEKLSFANNQDLIDKLKLKQGSVSPFSLIYNKDIFLIIDDKIWNSEFVSFHPNTNTETLEISGKDFQKYVKSLQNTFKLI